MLALLALLVWKVVHNPTSPVQRAEQDRQIIAAPLFTKNRVDTSGTLSLASLRGKVVVINFWQSYCAPCTHEARILAEGSRRWADKDVVFLGIDEQDLRNPALKFMRRFGITYPNVADNLGLVGHYGVTGYPETFFVDRSGRVIPPHVIGPVTVKTLDDGIKRALSA